MQSNPIPDHVPPGFVKDFNLFTSPGMAPTPNGDPHAAVACVHGGAPIFFLPITRAMDGGPG